MPSTLMENFFRDFRILKLFAKHYKTGETIPEEFVQQKIKEDKIFEGIALEEDIFYSILDIKLHQLSNPTESNVLEIYEKCFNEYKSFNYLPNTNSFSRFMHLYGYGAGYYSYLYCRMASSCIWKTCFQKDPLNRDVGEKYRNSILLYGGSRDPNQMLVDMIGREPNLGDLID